MSNNPECVSLVYQIYDRKQRFNPCNAQFSPLQSGNDVYCLTHTGAMNIKWHTRNRVHSVALGI